MSAKRSTVWLATLSTVVGIATGMFTLRDQVLDPGGDQAQASIPDYERAINPICDALNETERRRPRDVARLRRGLERATTEAEQRDALMVGVRRTLGDSTRQLAKFNGLDVPEQRKERHEATVAAWERNVERLRAYESDLDTATNRAGVVRAIKRFAKARRAMGRDGDTRDAGLEALAGGQCLDERQATAPVALPLLSSDGPASGGASRSTASASAGADPAPQSGTGSDAAPSLDITPLDGDLPEGTGPDVTPEETPSSKGEAPETGE